jgi:two-component system, NtrC family, sensor kinase
MTRRVAAQAGERAQVGPQVMALPSGWSLRTRLALLLGLAIALVIGVTTYFQFRVFERAIDDDLSEAARLTARAVADDIELRGGPFTSEGLTQTLREFVETVPEFGSITVVTLNAGKPGVFASTSPAVGNGSLEAGRQAIERRDLVWSSTSARVRVLAVPLSRDSKPFGAVAVTVSFDALIRLRNTGRVIAAWSTLLSIVSLFIVVELLTRWFIHRPIDAIRDTVGAVAAGSLDARAPVLRSDEIGAVATGLNRMLDELQDLHGSLQSEVARATAELRQRNRELVDSYQQMFRLREELGRSQQLAAVGETASQVAHQIGTPLNLVSGHIQLLLEQQDPNSAIAGRLRVAEEQIGKVTTIVQGLLDRSRRRLEREPLDLSEVIGRLCTLVQPALDTAKVRLSYERRPMGPIVGDVAELELALLNLISNALDAMPEGGDLTIRLADSGEEIRVEIADTGAGIPPEVRDHIFEPWFSTKGPGRGTGLGLSITRSVVAEHGGRLEIRSDTGHGTTVAVILPAVAPATDGKTSHA